MIEKEKEEIPVEEIKELLRAVSTEIPTLIKSVIASVFSEEAGRNMGKAAGAFYKELINSGMPPDVAVRMTENYIGVFTNLSELLKGIGKSGKGFMGKTGHQNDWEKELEKRIKEKIKEKHEGEEETE